MIVMLIKVAIPFFLLLMQGSVLAQNQLASDKIRDIANTDLEEVISQASRLDDKLTSIVVRARAAALISYSDPARSETMFLQTWKLANERTEKDFDREQAQLQILKFLFPRNSKLARRLLAEQMRLARSSPPAGAADPDTRTRLSPKLALQLVEVDPVMAATLLEETLSTEVTPAGLGALSRLRETDSFLSDYVAARTLDELIRRPTLLSLPSLQLMTGYVFPGPEYPVSSVEAETSLQQLQLKYFVTSYDVLRASLSETKESLIKDYHYTERDLQYRNANQGQIAAILAALAPRLAPTLSVELNDIAGKLAPQIPANIAQMTQFALRRLKGEQLTSEDPEQQFAFALSKGDFAEARRQLDLLKDDQKKEAYTQLLARNEARTLLKQSEILKAVTLIRNLTDQTPRLVMYTEALKAARKKRDAELTRIIIDEARLLVPQVDRNGVHARALLLFATQLSSATSNDEAIDFLSSAVTTINALAMRTNEQSEPKSMTDAALAELNNPNSLLDAPEMEQAFSAAGLIDLERTLEQAKRIEPRAVQLAARLEAIQGVIKRPVSKPKSVPQKPVTKSVDQSVLRL
jgi:hypothetical protein